MSAWRFHGHAVAVVVVLVVLAGCVAGPAGPRDAGDGATTTRPPPENQSVAGVHVSDTSPSGGPVIEGGIVAPAASSTYVTTRYATVVGSASEADRFNHSALDPAASAFVHNTSFADSYLVVVQSFPESSTPDYRLASLTRTGDTLHLGINDSSRGGTADVTVETMLVRVEGDPPDAVTVTTEEGESWQSSAGVVTETPTTVPPPNDLPFTATDPTENVDDPRDVLVANRGSETSGYRVELEYLEEPECREETPPCAVPTREVAVLSASRKLPANASDRFADVAGRIGDYTITVEADVPGPDGSRETIAADAHWQVDRNASDVRVVITDDDVRVETDDSTG